MLWSLCDISNKYNGSDDNLRCASIFDKTLIKSSCHWYLKGGSWWEKVESHHEAGEVG